MKIVFMGTPEFAVPCLEALKNAGHELLAVFTQPDKPKGRKYKISPPPVKIKAMDMGIPVYQPATLKDGDALNILKQFEPEIIIVAAYGKILPKEILQLPKFGCVNVHASLLPRHRGASPIQWAIISGDTKTGITIMQMDEGLDTGDILKTASIDIHSDEDAQSLHDRLSKLGAELLCKTLPEIGTGLITPVKQDDSRATYAPIINREMGMLDFTKPAIELYNLIRGFNPWPTAFTTASGKRLKVFKSRLAENTELQPGTAVADDQQLKVACGDGILLELLEVQPEGSRRMTAAEYLRGHSINTGDMLG